MRDKIKSEEYFKKSLSTNIALLDRGFSEIERGNIKQEQILPFSLHIVNMLVNKLKIKYSLSFFVNDLYEDYYICIDLVSKHWSGNKKLMWTNKEVLNQYGLSDYDVMLWLLSIGYLLDVPNEKFMLLVDVLEKDNIKDELFETIICAKIPKRKKVFEKKKVDFSVFKSILKAINAEEETESIKFLGKYLKTDWYKGHKGAGWHDSHKSKTDSYSGYWCFEAAAISSILGLDDTNLRSSQYYPSDLADYYRDNA